ncbi:MAG: Hsp20/alpha crystallin family protein [Acidobacteria bacterium]|nr:Hsp20/alpha crystallin family protein [Acidobacteriota bacterium]
MSAVVTWEPLRNLARIQDEMARFMRGALESDRTGSFGLPVDIVETEDAVLLLADMPGVDRDKIDLSVENRSLTITGERAVPKEFETHTVYHTERMFGKFSRSFVLPTTVDVNQITADYREGVLRVCLPKAEQARPRRIEVRGS